MDMRDSNYTNGHDADNLSCLNFTNETAHIVYSAKMSISSCAIIANLVAIAFVVFAKRYRDFLYRLMVYLMITDILQALATVFVSLPVHIVDGQAVVKKGQHGGCIASGFFMMATMWMGNIIFFWISLCLAYRGWCLYRYVDSRRDDKMESVKLLEKDSHRSKFHSHIKEIVSAFIVFVVPFAIASIPFAVEHNRYGISGLWCWIKSFSHSCGDLHYKILILMLVFFYGPLMIIVLLAVVFIMIAFCCYCRGEVRKNDKDQEKKERYVKEIVILLPLPLVYWTACMFLLINRIYSTLPSHDETKPFQQLWIVHAVADSTRSMLPALAFLLHPCVWKDKAICLSKSKPHAGDPDTDSPQASLTTAPPEYQNKGRGYYGSCNMSDTNSVFDSSTKSYDWD